MNRLLAPKYRAVVERSVSKSMGERFEVGVVRENRVSSMHDAAFFEGTLGTLRTPFSVFVKLGTNPFSPEQFAMEAQGLDYIRAHSSVRTPLVIDIATVDGEALLILEVIDTVRPTTKEDFAVMGRGFAELHRVENDRCGFDFPTYLGVFRQDNTWKNSWREFYGECRLLDSLQMAVRAGNMNAKESAVIEKLVERLPFVCPEPKNFSLLHGDPWIGNLLFDGRGLVLIDCSLYYGNREIDLTTVDFFCPVSEHFFAAYEEAFPKEDGFAERASLWKINQWLGHVTLYGDKYKEKLWQAVRPYL